MIIPIYFPENASKREAKFPPQLAKFGTDEVVLIEIQGSFQVEGNKSGQLAAKLKLGENDTKPTMIVGHHLLEGKIVNLSKPLAVMKKRRAPKPRQSKDTDAMDVEDVSESVDETGVSVEYDIVAVVKKKVLFGKRPMPMPINVANLTPEDGAKFSTRSTLGA